MIGTSVAHLKSRISSSFVAYLSKWIDLYVLREHLMALIRLWAREGPSDPGVSRATGSNLDPLIQDCQV